MRYLINKITGFYFGEIAFNLNKFCAFGMKFRTNLFWIENFKISTKESQLL